MSRAQLLLQQRNAAAQIQPQVERHLLVARAAGVQAPAGVADARDELALDEAVHVLVVAARPTPDPARPCSRIAVSAVGDRRGVVGVEHAGTRQRLGPREAAGDVVFEEPAIERKRDAEIERRGIGSRIEAAGPEMLGHEVDVES